LDFDEEIIAASIFKTYHIPKSEQDDMLQEDYNSALAGIDGDTPLGNIVRIRSEKDPKKIEKMSTWEKEQRLKWQEFKILKEIERIQNMTEKEKEERRREQVKEDDILFATLSSL
jgi:hypothetical protein